MPPFHLLGQDGKKELQHNFFGHVILLAPDQHHVMPMALLHLFHKVTKMRPNIGTAFGITYCQWHQTWQHGIALVKKIEMK